jgi:hypothetical protein
MFGHGWEKHEGTIVEGRMKRDSGVSTNTPFWEFIVDVRPAGQPDGPPIMRAHVHQPHGDEGFWPPDPGDTVTVEVNSEGKVRFDRHDPRLSYHERMKHSRDSFDARLHEPPGT